MIDKRDTIVEQGVGQLVRTYSREFRSDASENCLYNALVRATQDSGATVYQTGRHDFHPVGLTAFVILGESHTALHSFPEVGKVWVEMATCTDKIDVEKFFSSFESYLEDE